MCRIGSNTLDITMATTDSQTEVFKPVEAQNEKSLREQDIKEFWKGFEKFRKDNPYLEIEVKTKVDDAYLGAYGYKLDEKRFNTATETMLLFLYNANLTKQLQPALTNRVPIPNFVIKKGEPKDSFGHRYRYNTQTWEVLNSWFEVNIDYLVNPDLGYSSQVEPWAYENDKTVSINLPDWIVVEVATAGAEEYAHALFTWLKDSNRFKKATEEGHKIEANYQSVLVRKDLGKADVIYHTKDIERRALVWKQRILEKYLPHWTCPTRDLVDKVGKLRIKNRSNNDSFLRKFVPFLNKL